MALKDNPLMGAIATIVIASSAVAFNVATVSIMGNSVSEFVMFLLPLSMFVGYALSDVQSGQMEKWELGAVVLPTAIFLGMQYVTSITDLVANYQPFSGGLLVAISVLGFYAIVE